VSTRYRAERAVWAGRYKAASLVASYLLLSLLTVFGAVAVFGSRQVSANSQATATPSSTLSASPIKRTVVVVFDDMRFDDTKYLPQLSALAESKGQVLNNAFITCPLCCPSRASLLTGLLARNHRVTSNTDKLVMPTIFRALSDAGVTTGFIGKYLNSHSGKPLPEFDYWVSFRGGNVNNWLRPRMNINGRFRTVGSYISDVVLQHARIFTSRYADSPYVLYMNFTAPHRPAVTPSEYIRDCSDVALPQAFNSVDPSAPPQYQDLEELRPDKLLKYACDRAVSLKYVDQKLTNFIKGLVDAGTTVFIVSDNGVMLGEYRMREKAYPNPQVTRTPFFVFNYPKIDPNRVISLVDIPATILNQFALTPLVSKLDGIVLSEPRTSAIIEHFGSKLRLPFTAEATRGEIRVEYPNQFTQGFTYRVDGNGR
jgi:N-acetylglucosamine-6-sulfatase